MRQSPWRRLCREEIESIMDFTLSTYFEISDTFKKAFERSFRIHWDSIIGLDINSPIVIPISVNKRLSDFDSTNVSAGLRYDNVVFDEKENTTHVFDSLLFYDGSNGFYLKNHSWKSNTWFVLKGDEEILDADVEFDFSDLENHTSFLKDYFSKNIEKGELHEGFRFPVRVVSGAGLECKIEVFSDDINHENTITEMLDSQKIWNEANEKAIPRGGLIHNLYVDSRMKDKVVFRMDLGSAGFNGFNYLMSKLYASPIEIQEVIVS